MRFSKLSIRNFRCIGPEGLEIDFTGDENLAVLVGPNSAGKSNVISALGIVLGMYPFSRFTPDETDFHNQHTEEEILIELHLDPPLTDRDVYQREYEIAGFRYRVARYKKGAQGVLHTEHYCFDSEGNTLIKPLRIYKKKSGPDDDVDNVPKPVLVSDQSWKLGNLFYLDPPGLEKFFDKTTGWSPLGRLFEIYRNDFQSDDNAFSISGGRSIPAREALEKLSKRLAEVLKTKKLAEIEQKLSCHLTEYAGLRNDQAIEVSFSLPTHRELFERWVELKIAEMAGGISLPVDRLGSGYRTLLRIAVLETLVEMDDPDRKFVILLEEPEVYLHVHLKRHFKKVLRRLAEMGHQVILTTHAPEFVDLSRPHEIVRLSRLFKGPTSARQVTQATKMNFEKMRQKLARKGNEEIFFSSFAILTEGQDDQAVTRELLVRKGVDPDAHSISVVDCDSVSQIPDYVRLCHELGIDFFVIHDRDKEATDAAIKKRNADIENLIRSYSSQRLCHHVHDPNLEGVMGTIKQPSGNIEHLMSLLGTKTYAQLQADFPKLVEPIESFAKGRAFL